MQFSAGFGIWEAMSPEISSLLNKEKFYHATILELAAHLMSTGQASRVIDDGHRVLGEVSDPSSPIVSELTLLIQKAHASLLTAMG